MDNYREIGDEYREAEARRKYRLSHPLIEKVKINPIEAVIELSLAYFNDNPEAKEHKISKAELGKIWNLSINPQNRLIAGLVSENAFIIDSKRGFLIVERQGLEEYLALAEQLINQKDRVRTINEKYPRLTKEIEELEVNLKPNEEKIALMEKDIEEKQERIDKQANRINDLEGKSNKLIEEIKANSSKLKEAKNKNESLEKEQERVSNELIEIYGKHNQIIGNIQTNQSVIKRKNDMTTEEILKERINRLSSENDDFKAENTKMKQEKRGERHEILKGFFFFMIIIGFFGLVEYGLWYFIENKINFAAFSALFVLIYYLLLTRL